MRSLLKSRLSKFKLVKSKPKLLKFRLLKSRKAEFFVLSTFMIVSCLYIISKYIEPGTIIDTSSVALMEESFVFNNIVEKANETVLISKSCEDLSFNLEEYKIFVQKFATEKNFQLTFDYIINSSCSPPPSSVTVNFTNITLISSKGFLNKTFSVIKTFS